MVLYDPATRPFSFILKYPLCLVINNHVSSFQAHEFDSHLRLSILTQPLFVVNYIAFFCLYRQHYRHKTSQVVTDRCFYKCLKVHSLQPLHRPEFHLGDSPLLFLQACLQKRMMYTSPRMREAIYFLFECSPQYYANSQFSKEVGDFYEQFQIKSIHSKDLVRFLILQFENLKIAF